MSANSKRLLVAHVVFRFDVGGLENGVVNLVNALPVDRFRHAVVVLTDISRDFADRVAGRDVQFVALRKPPGPGYRLWPALYRTFRNLRPDIVHTRNLAPLEATAPAWLAGVPVRIHGEHGWDVGNLDGANLKDRWVRRSYRPFVTHYIALSRHIATYLESEVGIGSKRISQIYNGVETARFRREQQSRLPIVSSPFNDPRLWVAGTVGRLVDVKDQASLVRALAVLHHESADARSAARLAVVGGGPLQGELAELARSEGVGQSVWFAGERHDIPNVMRGLDAFVLPSLAEGISNTILEAMSSSLPVIATRVGGNGELVEDGVTGTLVRAADTGALARAMLRYFKSPELAEEHGRCGRERVERLFSLQGMIDRYRELYEGSTRRDGSIPLRKAAGLGKGALGS